MNRGNLAQFRRRNQRPRVEPATSETAPPVRDALAHASSCGDPLLHSMAGLLERAAQAQIELGVELAKAADMLRQRG